MFLVDPKVFRFVVKGVKAIFWGVQRGWGLLQNPMGNLKFRTLMLITSNWIMIESGQVHGAWKERRIIIIIIRNGAKTISLQTLFGRLNDPYLPNIVY
jgi:hypothetical protein